MNRTVTIESKNHKYATTYGGYIYASDFNIEYNGTRNMAERILSDWKFDEQRRKDIENKNKKGELR